MAWYRMKEKDLEETPLTRVDDDSSDEIRAKLDRDSPSSLLASSGRDGFTFVIAMKPAHAFSNSGGCAITLLRFLVGSNSVDSVPRKLVVQGRPIALHPGKQKWYDVYLTCTEIALAVRSGYVSISVEACYDSCCTPAIDAIDVYATDRDAIASWLPTRLISVSSPAVCLSASSHDQLEPGTQRIPALLLAGLQSFERLCRFVGPNKALSSVDKQLLKQMLKETALWNCPTIKHSVGAILATVGRMDETARIRLQDQAVLQKCCELLSTCRQSFVENSSSENFETWWQPLGVQLRICFRLAAAIAKCRPSCYVESVESLGDGILSPGSIASSFLPSCFERSSTLDPHLLSEYIGLVVVEMMAVDKTRRGNINGLQGLSELLLSAKLGPPCANAVSKFCVASTVEPEKFRVMYQCDGCGELPIKNVRYSLPHDESFDLCRSCYDKGRKSAASGSDKLQIDGRATNITRSELDLMKAVPIQVKQKEVGSECTEQLRSGDFMEYLFSELVSISTKDHKMSVVQLAINIVNHSASASRLDRAKRLAEVLASRLAQALSFVGKEGRESSNEEVSVVCDLLQALVRLAASDDEALTVFYGDEDGSEVADVTAGRPPCCDTHGIPTVRRSCFIRGRERRFFTCAKEKKLRCNFFLWSDVPDESKARLVIDEVTSKALWNLLTSGHPESSSTIEASLEKFTTAHVNHHSLLDCSKSMKHIHTLDSAHADFAEGVQCSRSRLHDIARWDYLTAALDRSETIGLDGGDRNMAVVETALTLLSLTARPGYQATSTWSPLLSEIIISSNQSSRLKPLAKRALLQLCGRKRGLYATIRHHYAFGYQRQQLAIWTSGLLTAGVTVIEKARQCGQSWKGGVPLSLKALKAADLLGTDELVAEDVTTMQVTAHARQVLTGLTSLAKKRGDTFRQFCGLRHFKCAQTLEKPPRTDDICKLPPIVFFFSLASLLSGDNQVKVLRLIDLALSPRQKHGRTTQSSSHVEGHGTETSNTRETPAFPFASSSTPEEILNLSVKDLHLFSLRYVCRGVNSELRTVASSIVSRICDDQNASAAGQLFEKLCGSPVDHLGRAGKDGAELVSLLLSLLKAASSTSVNVEAHSSRVRAHWIEQMQSIRHGRSNHDYVFFEARTASSYQKKRFELSKCLHCQKTVTPRKDKTKSSKTSDSNAEGDGTAQGSALSPPADPRPVHPEQVTQYSRGRLEGWRDATTSDEFNAYASFKYRLALSEVHLEVSDPRGRFVSRVNIYFSPRPVADVTELKRASYSRKWQLCGHMELSKGATRGNCKLDSPVAASNIRIEYAEFYERPGDSKTSDSNFVVHCPRCTRVVTNAHGVCGNCGEVAFQCRKCRHINYEKLNAFLCVECGYCASGGECLSRDSSVWTSSYLASPAPVTGFSYELTAAIASNAIAICNDAEYERTRRQFAIAERLHDDLQATLRDQLMILLRKNDGESTVLKRAFQGGLPLQSDEAELQPVTLSKLGKPGSVVKAVARPDGRLDDRASSLVRLTREWRETTTDASRRPTIRRQLSRLLAQDGDGVDQERFSWLDGAVGSESVSRLLASVQSRRERRAAAATAAAAADRDGDQGRSASGEGTSAVTGTTTTSPSGKTGAQLTKESLEICDKLSGLMREAERESHALQQRISAWERLESDSLQGEVEDSIEDAAYQVSRCSCCASTTALYLLNLWLALLEADPDNVIVTPDMVRMLLLEDYPPPVHKPLQEAKRATVKQIALLSKSGADVVLDALRVRLEATESVACAEILGKIVSASGPPAFLELALKVLDTSTASDIPSL